MYMYTQVESKHLDCVLRTIKAELLSTSYPPQLPRISFYDPTYTRENHIKDGVRTSVARSRYFSQLTALAKDYVAAPLFGWNLLMKYSMGTPVVSNYGIFDTGSSFTWIQCRPCIHCYKQGNYPVFNPQNSSSYRQVQCTEHEFCSMAPGYSCGSSTTTDPDFPFCVYHASYMDKSSRGSHSPGIVGLGNHSASLVRQFTVSHFSHYVFANGTHLRGVATVWEGSIQVRPRMSTPLLPNDHGVYYLNLTGISVDGSSINLPAGIFEKSRMRMGLKLVYDRLGSLIYNASS
ncbi:Aspartic proteinase CDR1 [Bienertia sinuspersici]